MYDSQAPYRSLFNVLMDKAASAAPGQAIDVWATANPGERVWLEALRGSLRKPPKPLEDEAACRLYALTRCFDQLITRATAIAPSAEAAHLTQLAEALGLEVQTPTTVHPFDCELHGVIQADDPSKPPSLDTVHWPAMLLGPLLILRAGVTITVGAEHIDKTVAETSTLYWCHCRNRPTEDQSAGWGSNSQWRTAHRQDYAFDDAYYYNVIDPKSLPPWGSDIDPAYAQDLLRHRCFIRPVQAEEELYPYHESLVEARMP